jgi:formylglycine-generating enzyme required for sulfatase activity
MKTARTHLSPRTLGPVKPETVAGKLICWPLLRRMLFGLLLGAVPCLAADPEPKITIDLGNGFPLVMILIKPGTFMLGSKKPWDTREKPSHEVTLTRPYYLGQLEVTEAQWQAVTGENPAKSARNLIAGNRPVINVSWNDIHTKFLPLVAKRVPRGLTPRLPTEAEWEYACRAGSPMDFCFGDDVKLMPEYGWFDDNSDWRMMPVMQKKPNVWGLYDMHGNAWEWCSDWMDPYSEAKQIDPSGPPEGKLKVLRGGCVFVRAIQCRSTNRMGLAPTTRGDNAGFRLAVSLAEPTK